MSQSPDDTKPKKSYWASPLVEKKLTKNGGINFAGFFDREVKAPTPEEIKAEECRRLGGVFDFDAYQYKTVRQQIEEFFAKYENLFVEYGKELQDKKDKDFATRATQIETGLKSLSEQKAEFFATDGNYNNLETMINEGAREHVSTYYGYGYGYSSSPNKYYSDALHEQLGQARRDLEKAYKQYCNEKSPGSGPAGRAA